MDQFQSSSDQLESTGLCRARDPLRCQLTGSTETLCLLKLPQLHCGRPVQPCLMMSEPPPPPRTPPSFTNFVMLGCAEPRRSTLTNFCRHITNLRVLGSALSDGPYNAADVVDLLKTSVQKGDTEEEATLQRGVRVGLSKSNGK